MSGTAVLKRLIAMKRNPRNDWTIEDVAFLCRGIGLECTKPPSKSHFAVSHPKVEGLLTIPAGKPIKPFYTMLLVQLAERALEVE